jgi:hypothetical protein
MNETSGRVIKDTCGYGDGVISGDHYALSPQGVTWEAGGSQIRTSATIMPRSVLACFTHVFGGTRYPGDVTKLFEKFPSLLTTDETDGNAIFLEAQDGHKQHRNVANLGYLYFTEGRSRNEYIAATTDGTNGGPHCLVLNRVATGGDQFYLDGRMATAYDASTGGETLGDGHLVIGGRLADPDYWFHGTLHLMVLWDTETLTSQAAVNQAMSWANDQLRKKGLPAAGEVPAPASDLQSRFVIVGDSITACQGPAIVNPRTVLGTQHSFTKPCGCYRTRGNRRPKPVNSTRSLHHGGRIHFSIQTQLSISHSSILVPTMDAATNSPKISFGSVPFSGLAPCTGSGCERCSPP